MPQQTPRCVKLNLISTIPQGNYCEGGPAPIPGGGGWKPLLAGGLDCCPCPGGINGGPPGKPPGGPGGPPGNPLGGPPGDPLGGPPGGNAPGGGKGIPFGIGKGGLNCPPPWPKGGIGPPGGIFIPGGGAGKGFWFPGLAEETVSECIDHGGVVVVGAYVRLGT